MVINHLEKLFVTNDAATILRELDVEHPAAKILVLASEQQELECGDGTNFVIGFAGALLENAEDLLRMVRLLCLQCLPLYFYSGKIFFFKMSCSRKEK